MNTKNHVQVLSILKKHYPNAQTVLTFATAWEMVVATILSAQCTDQRVNIVTKQLFKKYKTIKDYAQADIHEFENDIRSTGFFRNKARNIIGAAQTIISDFKGNVPDSMEQLLHLPGVARKTANVVLHNAFHKSEGIAVDTHVRRLSQRLGLSKYDDPVKIEQDLMRLFLQKEWGAVTYCLIEHGRKICEARKPRCPECPVKSLCPSSKKFCRRGK